MLGKLIRLEKPFEFLESGSYWFAFILALSLMIRLYLVIFTEGTYDITNWQRHAQEIQRIGLIEYYKASLGDFNHSPVAGYLASFCLSLSKWSAIPFKVLFRLPFALQDFLIAFYLIKIFAANKYKYLFTAFFLLCPLTFILSSYHGNTDSALGLFGLACLYYVSINAYIAAGIILGLGTWVKWIIALILPVIFFSIPVLKNKARFLISFLAASAAGYLWFLAKDPGLLFNSIFGYRGQLIQTTAGIPVWGNRILYTYLASASSKAFNFPTQVQFIEWTNFLLMNNGMIILAAVILYAWLRKNRNSPADIGRSIGEAYCIFYAATNFWSFQYFAWAIPFWLFINRRLALVVYFFTTMYIYSLYSLVCGSYFLLGKWDFIGHPYLSGNVLFFRNSCILLFAVTAVYFLGKAGWEKIYPPKTGRQI